MYTRDPIGVGSYILSNDGFRRELTFEMAHVYRKYSVFTGLSRKDIKALFKDRWKYFRFQNLRISVNFVDPLMRADDFLSTFKRGKRTVLRGVVADSVGCYHMPYIIPLTSRGKDRLVFTWLFLYNGAFRKGDIVEVSGRECSAGGSSYILVEAPQDYIRKLTGRTRSRMLPSLKKVKVALARESDASRIVSFLSDPEIDQSFVYPLSRRDISIEERVRSKFPKGFWLVASFEGKVVGCRGCIGVVDRKHRIVEFSTTAIDPVFRGSGLGVLLLRKAVESAFERYAPLTMKFDSWSTNKAMEKAALRAGFTKTRVFDDPTKRPPGVKSAEYVLDCSKRYSRRRRRKKI